MENPWPVKHIFKNYSAPGFRRVRLIQPCNWDYDTWKVRKKYLDSVTKFDWHIHVAAKYNNGEWN